MGSKEYHVGYKVAEDDEEYAAVADWCNRNMKVMAITDERTEKGTAIYMASEPPEPTEEERKESERKNLMHFLSETDNYAIRLASGEASPDDWSSTYGCTFARVMEMRAEARTRLAELTPQAE